MYAHELHRTVLRFVKQILATAAYGVYSYPSRCWVCDSRSKLLFTRSSNRNGNAGRPYYKCTACAKFLCFADDRGLDLDNPQCHCGAPSRRQVSGPTKRVSRGLHYVCSRGGCSFYPPVYGERGQLNVDEELVGFLAQLRIV